MVIEHPNLDLKFISAVMTADPNLMNKLVTEEQNRTKLLIAKFAEMMQLAGVSTASSMFRCGIKSHQRLTM